MLVVIVISLAHSTPSIQVNVFIAAPQCWRTTVMQAQDSMGRNWSGPAGHFSRSDKVLWSLSCHEGQFWLLVYLKNTQEKKVLLSHPYQPLENTLIVTIYTYPVPFSLYIPFICNTSIMRKLSKIYQQCKKYVDSQNESGISFYF